MGQFIKRLLTAVLILVFSLFALAAFLILALIALPFLLLGGRRLRMRTVRVDFEDLFERRPPPRDVTPKAPEARLTSSAPEEGPHP